LFQVEFDGCERSNERSRTLRGLARRAILGAINSSANVWSLAPGENLRQQVVGFGHFGIADIEEGA
jgi:hypothetical protein